MTVNRLRTVVGLVGIGLITVSTSAYDWRVGLFVFGFIALIISVVGIVMDWMQNAG